MIPSFRKYCAIIESEYLFIYHTYSKSKFKIDRFEQFDIHFIFAFKSRFVTNCRVIKNHVTFEPILMILFCRENSIWIEFRLIVKITGCNFSNGNNIVPAPQLNTPSIQDSQIYLCGTGTIYDNRCNKLCLGWKVDHESWPSLHIRVFWFICVLIDR